ncbi:MAG: hypothetical protein M3Y31_02375 [Gemmatimonadota bacterium]|nr:hypothetical protein [Gemmatimonadota bacterium]
MRRRVGLSLFLVAALACSSGAPQPDVPADTAQPASASEAAIPDSIPLLVVEQEGGIGGASSELTLFRNGDATLARDPAPGGIPVRRWTVAPADYQAIEALLRRADFRALDAEYLPDDTCCDRITYTITVPGAAESRTIRTMDAAQQPDILAELIERLRALETTAPQ